MTPEETKIARAFVACGRWRWMPGMMTEGWRLTCVSLHDGAWSATSTLAHREYHYPTLPDINDPATLGCLLALVRAARAEPCWLPTCLQDQEVDEAWVVETPSRDRQTRHESYAAVLVAALKAAEGREDTP